MINILRKGAAARETLDRLQGEIEQLIGERNMLSRSRLPHEETREVLLRSLQDAMYRYAPEAQFESLQSRDIACAEALRAELTLADVCYIDGPEAVADKIMARIKATGRTVGPSAAEYAKTMAGLQSRLDALERNEELEVLRLEAEGHVILRRESACPELLLRIWGEQQTDRAAA